MKPEDEIDKVAEDTKLLVDALRGYPGFSENGEPPVPMPDWWPRTRVPCLTPYLEMWDEEQEKKAKLIGADEA